jgi:hypothetical protein
MKKWIAIIFFAILVTGMIFMSGCTTQDNNKYCSDNFPGTYYDPSSKMCEHTPTPTPTPTSQIISQTVLVTQTTIPTPTPIPTINKNSIAYQNYQYDLREIEAIKTDLAIIQSNYLADMQAAGRDVASARALTMDYNKLKAAYDIRLKAAQARADADLAGAEGG